MSGHSKWHTIKHKKGAADAKRGKVFTRLIKELTVAARAGGGDPDMNPRLRTIVAEAKAQNMPAENIKRAIRRGTGEEPGVSYEEANYEGYGPGGVAIIIETLTDNKNRTVGEIRHLLDKHNGKLGERNSVARLFTKRGQILVEKSKADEADADGGRPRRRRRRHAGRRRQLGDPDRAGRVRLGARRGPQAEHRAGQRGGRDDPAELREARRARTRRCMLRLMDALEDHDDVQHVWSNFDIDEKEIEASLA